MDGSFTDYLKQTTEKTQGTQENRNSSHPGKSNSSQPWPALKAATLEMIEKDKEKRKKKRKTNLKNNKKKKENSNGKKNKHR